VVFYSFTHFVSCTALFSVVSKDTRNDKMNIDIVSRVRAAESGDLPANLLIDKFNTVKCGRLPFTYVNYADNCHNLSART